MILFIAGGWFPMLAFPLIGSIVQNGPEPSRARGFGAALRTLDGEDRSERIEEEGKQMLDSGSRNEGKPDGLRFVCQPWFYLRLEAYSFFRLSEGA
jgi:hypothetical protein